MIQYLTHQEIDFNKWDEAIDQSINGIIYPYAYYLDQVAPGWSALVYNDYDAVMPLPNRTKMGFSYIFQPFFVQQLGIFFKSPPDQQLIELFLTHIPGKFRFIQYNLNTHNPLKRWGKAQITKNRTYELDLISPYEQLRKNYSGQTQRNLKKSRREKVFVTKNSDPMPIIDSFKTHRGKAIRNMGPEVYNMFKHLVYSGIYRGNTICYSAYSAENTFCAGVIFFRSHKKSILIFSGSTPQARGNGAMTAIIDQYIREHSGKNLTLDFEGSNDDNLARFYKGFGSKECVYLQLRINKFPLILKPLAELYFLYRKKQAAG